MKLRLFLQFPALFAAVVCLHSCDQEVTDDPDIVFKEPLLDRFDATALAENPTGTVNMPVNLVENDIFTYTVNTENLTANFVNIPKSDGQSDDWVIKPVTSGDIFIETQLYGYLNGRIFAKAEANTEPFDDNIGVLRETSLNTPGVSFANVKLGGVKPFFDSINGFLQNDIPAGVEPDKAELSQRIADTGRLSDIDIARIRDGIRNLGYIVVENPAAKGVAGFDWEGSTTTRFTLTKVWIPIDGIVVLTGGGILHTPTSINQDILDNSEIRGDFTLTKGYANLYLTAENSGDGAGDGAGGEFIITVGRGEEDIPQQAEQPNAINIGAEGTFVLKLGGIGSPNPNPSVNPNP